MGRRLSLAAGTVAVVTAAVAHAGIARAEFTETFCSGGSAAAPWQNGVGGGGGAWGEVTDACGSGGGYGFDNATDTMTPGGTWSAGIVAPPGEVFTGASLDFSTEPLSSGSETFVVLGDAQAILSEYETDNGAAHAFASGPLPDTSEFWARYDCSTSASTSCNLQNWGNTLDLAAVTLTVLDTTDPSISADGGSLNTHGATATLAGTQSVAYDASAGGSGVAGVTVSLGTTVVGSAASTCQSASLTPCPGSATGVIAVNTALVPDGTYPVILTASNASGGQSSANVGNVTVDNAAATTTVKPGGRRPSAIRTKVTFDWDPRARSTSLIWTHFGRLPPDARISLTCTGHGCPFHRLRATAHRVRTLERQLRNRSFHAGDRLRLTITAPHRTAETGTELIRRGKEPVTLAPRRRRHR
jgi:hypothetical protein